MKLLPALTARFGDRDTSIMILAAKMHPETAKVAELLEIEQIEHWIKAGKNPDQVFELMDFDFQSLSSINKWFCFVDKYFLSHERLSFNPILTLEKRFSISELVRMIAKERNPNNVEGLKELVIHSLFNSMQSNLCVLGQLSDGGQNNVIVNSLLNSRKQFSENIKKLPDITMLENSLDSELLTSDIMYQLKFKDRAHDGLLLNAYDVYVSAYNKQSPAAHFTLLAVLITRFGSNEVLKMIYSAKSDLVVMKFAKHLEDDQ
ncbi:uncharacterized protein PHALS_08214 [Plasmopara halstedii]|uniref:Uncharacterized protein n=1 Tax=Plasmopara halstedii TaxID=4781 RepID=A0A0P1ACZ6_PLAHL|nr:uncharacterized protein PHALS_08214 [Plasmopara halstedii]CEG38122.1 hypothetical protein PHALS_08214 [Plasmopara halstedii]|eukprot:XP_024574491.1 hypothetical protein PHALS_08214 [Plasmopara halstedii]